MEINKRIMELENELAVLPQGSINIKKINGKEQPYLQWTENGSQYFSSVIPFSCKYCGSKNKFICI